jgi:indole-3-glycerol phosphate synthase
MSGILDEIVAHKRAVELPRTPPVDRALLRDLPPCRGFAAALRRPAGQPVRVIAECKKASPSKGVIRADYDPVLMAFHYVLGGASCLSVLTDERWFQGHLDHLKAVRAQVAIPCIRKDFIVDERQIAEARLAGADAVLLIAACLGDGELRDLQGFAHEIGLDVLVEVHDADEAARAVRLDCPLVGVNNRNLRTFAVDLRTTLDLAPGLVDGKRTVVGESGIETRDHCRTLEDAGIDAVLVGESLMRSPDAVAALHRLRGTVARGP